MPSDVTRSKIGDLSKRTEEVLLLLVTDFDDLREKLEAEIGNIFFNYFIVIYWRFFILNTIKYFSARFSLNSRGTTKGNIRS